MKLKEFSIRLPNDFNMSCQTTAAILTEIPPSPHEAAPYFPGLNCLCLDPRVVGHSKWCKCLVLKHLFSHKYNLPTCRLEYFEHDHSESSSWHLNENESWMQAYSIKRSHYLYLLLFGYVLDYFKTNCNYYNSLLVLNTVRNNHAFHEHQSYVCL